jgi:hypothetical protein
MRNIVTGILDFVLSALFPAPERKMIPIRIDERRRRR